MRILIISHAYLTSIYREKFEFLGALPGVDLQVLIPEYYKKETYDGISPKHYSLILTRLPFSSTYHFFYYPQLTKILTKLQPDLVYAEEEPFNVATYLIASLCSSLTIPFVFFTWQNIEKNYPYPFRFFYNFVLSHSKHAIAGNQEAAHILQKHTFSCPVSIIPQMGITPNYFFPKKRLKLYSFSLVYVGRVVEEKGIAFLIHALTLLPSSIHLTFIGQGPFKKQLSNLVSKHKLQKRVHFLGYLPQKNLVDSLSQHHVLILPSLTTKHWKEQFGRVLIEAMACGLPVIGSTSGEVPHVIGNAGLIFPEGDVSSLASSILRLYNDKTLYNSLVKKGLARVKKHYLNKHLAQQLYSLFKKIYHENRHYP